jgi:hypothetical protein
MSGQRPVEPEPVAQVDGVELERPSGVAEEAIGEGPRWIGHGLDDATLRRSVARDVAPQRGPRGRSRRATGAGREERASLAPLPRDVSCAAWTTAPSRRICYRLMPGTTRQHLEMATALKIGDQSVECQIDCESCQLY